MGFPSVRSERDFGINPPMGGTFDRQALHGENTRGDPGCPRGFGSPRLAREQLISS